MAFVSLGDGHRLKIRTQDSRGRGSLLDLGNELDRSRAIQGSPKVAGCRCIVEQALQVLFGNGSPRLLDLPFLTGYNLVQDRGHEMLFPTAQSFAQKRCLELSGAQNSSIY